MCVREDNERALASVLVLVHKNLLIAPACICTLSIVRCLTLNIGISIIGAINIHNLPYSDRYCNTDWKFLMFKEANTMNGHNA